MPGRGGGPGSGGGGGRSFPTEAPCAGVSEPGGREPVPDDEDVFDGIEIDPGGCDGDFGGIVTVFTEPGGRDGVLPTGGSDGVLRRAGGSGNESSPRTGGGVSASSLPRGDGVSARWRPVVSSSSSRS